MLFGKYTRTFVPRFPGIPEMLYFPPPSASGNITSRGFPGTSGQTFWYISLKAMKYLYNISFVLPTGFRTLHFVSFLYVFFFSFLFLLFRFFSHYFVFVFFAFRFFAFLFVTFLLVFFSFFFFPFLFVSFRFFSVSQFTGTQKNW